MLQIKINKYLLVVLGFLELLFLVLLRLLVASVLLLCSFSATVHLIDLKAGEVSMTSDTDYVFFGVFLVSCQLNKK